MKIVRINVAPVAKGRPKYSKYGTYTPKKTREYEEYIKSEWLKCHAEPFEGALYAMLIFGVPIPKGSRKRQEMSANGNIKPTKRPDIDNYAKAVLDGLNGVAYKDDNQIVELYCCKKYAPEPFVEIRLEELESI